MARQQFDQAVTNYSNLLDLITFMVVVDEGIAVGFASFGFPVPPGMTNLNQPRSAFETAGQAMTQQQHQTYGAACLQWINQNPEN